MDELWLEVCVRAKACSRFRWMPGMAWWTEDDHGRLDDFQPEYMRCPPNALPDLRDPATFGCLLKLVRDVWGDPHLYVRLSDTRRAGDGVQAWEVLGWADAAHSPTGRPASWRGWGYATEAEALVAALEAAEEV